MTSRQYNLFLTGWQKLAVGLPLVMFTLFPLACLAMFSIADFGEFPASDVPPLFPVFPFLPFLAVAVYYAWSTFSLPYRISVTHDRQLVFKSFISTRCVPVSEVLSIEPRSLHIQAGVSGYVLKHRNGKVVFPGQFTEQYLLLYELKQANPQLDIRGC